MTMDATRRMVSRGYGKLILFGEHAVVYGVPAIVAGLPLGATAWVTASRSSELVLVDGRSGNTLTSVEPRREGESLEQAFFALLRAFDIGLPVRVNVTIDIPVGSGLGSSAAMATAAARALAQFAGITDIEARVKVAVDASEGIFHGNPSGIDAVAATRGGILRFTKGPSETSAQPLRSSSSIYLAICEAGPPASTAEMVEKVGELRSTHPQIFESLNRAIGDIVFRASNAITAGDLETLGQLANLNQGALNAFGVSTEAIERACFSAREAGAWGAKLTGSGGGGCVFAITDRDSVSDVLKSWNAQGFRAFQVVLPPQSIA